MILLWIAVICGAVIAKVARQISLAGDYGPAPLTMPMAILAADVLVSIGIYELVQSISPII